MSWTYIQSQGHASAGPAAAVSQTFDSVNTKYNVIIVVAQWQGTETVITSDDQNNAYFPLGNTATEGSGANQINTAIFWGIAYIVDAGVGLTPTVSFSDSNATQRYIAIAEFNPGLTFGINIQDLPSFENYSSPSGPTSPSISTLLANLAELLIVGVYTASRTQTIQPGWTVLGFNAPNGQSAYFQVMSSVIGNYVAQPSTISSSTNMAIACGALVPVNPTNIPPVPTPPYLPLYPPPAYPINMGSPGTTSLQNVLLEIASAKPYFTLLDWNGNPYTASELLQQGGSSLGTAYWASRNDNWADANFWASQAASALLQTPVEYSQTLGTIIWIKNGERFGTLYQIVPPVPSPPNTQIRYLNVMNHVATPTDPIVLVNPKITGLSLRITWAKFEPTQGVYDFSYFDTEIERAIGAGKDFIMLRVLVEQNNAPAWVYQISQWATFSSGQLWIYWASPSLRPSLVEATEDESATPVRA